MNATLAVTVEKQPPKALHVALWVTQVLLAAAFIMAGVMKSTTPLAELAAKLSWLTEVPAPRVRCIGLSELAGGLGLLLPAVTRIRPGLTALAGAGLTLVMVLAVLFHLSRGEVPGAIPSVLLGGLSAFVAWGRFRAAPIAPRR